MLAGACICLGIVVGAGLYAVGAPDRARAALRSFRDGHGALDGELAWRQRWSTLHDLEIAEIPLPESFEALGGATNLIGDSLVYVDTHGSIAIIDRDFRVTATDLRVPMNLKGMLADPITQQDNFRLDWFRTTDILALPRPGGYRLFAAHHHYVDACIEARLSSLDVAVTAEGLTPAGDWRTVVRAEPCVGFLGPDVRDAWQGDHSGGRLAFGPDSALYLSQGDLGLTGMLGRTRQVGMDPGTLLGKVVRIDLETGEASVYAMGLRNPAGLAFDPAGRLWVVDNGPQGGDEINRVLPGSNFGFPESTFGIDYGNVAWPFNPEQGRHAAYDAPVFAWTPGIAPQQIVPVDGRQFPLWRGDLLVASLASNALRRLRLHGDRVAYDEVIPFPGERLRDLTTLPDGRLAILTDSRKLILVRRAEADRMTGTNAVAEATPAPRVPGAEHGRSIFVSKCGACHSVLGAGGHAPPLGGVIGRKVGSMPGYRYSPTLQTRTERWTAARFRRFVTNPQSEFPGTYMTPQDLSQEQLAAVVQYLRQAAGRRDEAGGG